MPQVCSLLRSPSIKLEHQTAISPLQVWMRNEHTIPHGRTEKKHDYLNIASGGERKSPWRIWPKILCSSVAWIYIAIAAPQSEAETWVVWGWWCPQCLARQALSARPHISVQVGTMVPTSTGRGNLVSETQSTEEKTTMRLRTDVCWQMIAC